MRKTLLIAAAALATLPLATPADAAFRPIAFSEFYGLLGPNGPGSTHTSTYCQEVLVDVRTPATCEVSFTITGGRLTCDPDSSATATATASYTSHGAGTTVGGIPLTGVVVNDTGFLRGHVIEVDGSTPHVLTMIIKAAGACGENGFPTTFVGEVQYF